MSSVPPPDPPNNRPIPKEAIKFLKLSPSVKVMSLKKSSTTCRVKASQDMLKSASAVAGSSCAPAECGSREAPIRMKPIKKERKMISVLSAKSNKEARRQFLEKRGIGDEPNPGREMASGSKVQGQGERKHWYGRWMEALLSALK